jgi:hypothetical protein
MKLSIISLLPSRKQCNFGERSGECTQNFAGERLCEADTCTAEGDSWIILKFIFKKSCDVVV